MTERQIRNLKQYDDVWWQCVGKLWVAKIYKSGILFKKRIKSKRIEYHSFYDLDYFLTYEELYANRKEFTLLSKGVPLND